MKDPKSLPARRRQAASRLARSAFDAKDPARVMSRLRAALSLGLGLDDAVDVGEGARKPCPKATLPVLASTMGRWHLDGGPNLPAASQPRGDVEAVFDALGRLGADWTARAAFPSWDQPRTLMDRAAGCGNWRCARELARCGASWLEGSASPWDSPIAWLAFTRRDESPVDRLAWDEARAELESAIASGSAKAGRWFPLLGAVELSREGIDDKKATVHWGRWFKRAAKLGVGSWRATLPGGERSDALNQLRLGWVARPSFALALARRACGRPEALEAALATPGFEPDPRSLWALGASLVETCLAAATEREQVRAGRGAARALALLAPWRDKLRGASQEPAALKGREDERFEAGGARHRRDDLLGGWELALASLVAPAKEIPIRPRVVDPDVVRAIGALVDWMPSQPGSPGWEGASERFARAIWRRAPGAGGAFDEPGSARARRAVAGLEALARSGPAGQALACAAFARVAAELRGGFGGDYGWRDSMAEGMTEIAGAAMRIDMGAEPSRQGLWEAWGATFAAAGRHCRSESRPAIADGARLCAARAEADAIGGAAPAAPARARPRI